MKIIQIDSLGDVHFTKKVRSKNIRIRVKKDRSIHVSMPYFCTYMQAKKFLVSQSKWIQEQQDKQPKELSSHEIEFLREQAKSYIPERAKSLAQKHGLIFNQIRIKNITSRWGSCSGKKNLNFSLHLMRLEKKYIDYVILHELAHTVEMNHGPRFWALLEYICPGAKKIDKEMRHIKKM